MVSALAEAGAAAGEPAWVEAAVACAEFLLASLRRPDGRWLRSWQREGGAQHLAYAADHGALVDAFVRLAEATGQARWIAEARSTADVLLDLFWDHERGGVFDGSRLGATHRADQGPDGQRHSRRQRTRGRGSPPPRRPHGRRHLPRPWPRRPSARRPPRHPASGGVRTRAARSRARGRHHRGRGGRPPSRPARRGLLASCRPVSWPGASATRARSGRAGPTAGPTSARATPATCRPTTSTRSPASSTRRVDRSASSRTSESVPHAGLVDSTVPERDLLPRRDVSHADLPEPRPPPTPGRGAPPRPTRWGGAGEPRSRSRRATNDRVVADW